MKHEPFNLPAIRERLARDHPAVAQYQRDEAWTHYQIACLLREAHSTEAMESESTLELIFTSST